MAKSLEETVDKFLIDGSAPERVAEMLAEKTNESKERILTYIKNNYTLTNSPGRRSFDYCLRCNPYLNGSHGEDGTEAVAKHHIPDQPDMEQVFTGWEGVCYDCAASMENNPEIDLQPLSGYEDLDIFQDGSEEEITHECEDPTWNKLSLVTEEGMFDWVECDECGIQAKRYNPYNIDIIGFDAR